MLDPLRKTNESVRAKFTILTIDLGSKGTRQNDEVSILSASLIAKF